MRKVIPSILIVILFVTVLFPSLTGLNLGEKIIGNDSWVAEQIQMLKPLADVANLVSNAINKIVLAVNDVIQVIIDFFKNPWVHIFRIGE